MLNSVSCPAPVQSPLAIPQPDNISSVIGYDPDKYIFGDDCYAPQNQQQSQNKNSSRNFSLDIKSPITGAIFLAGLGAIACKCLFSRKTPKLPK